MNNSDILNSDSPYIEDSDGDAASGDYTSYLRDDDARAWERDLYAAVREAERRDRAGQKDAIGLMWGKDSGSAGDSRWLNELSSIDSTLVRNMSADEGGGSDVGSDGSFGESSSGHGHPHKNGSYATDINARSAAGRTGRKASSQAGSRFSSRPGSRESAINSAWDILNSIGADTYGANYASQNAGHRQAEKKKSRASDHGLGRGLERGTSVAGSLSDSRLLKMNPLRIIVIMILLIFLVAFVTIGAVIYSFTLHSGQESPGTFPGTIGEYKGDH